MRTNKEQDSEANTLDIRLHIVIIITIIMIIMGYKVFCPHML